MVDRKAPHTLSPHAWTMGPRLAHSVRPEATPSARLWTGIVEDPVMGRVRLTGLIREPASSRELLLVVHGLGGSCGSYYAARAAAAAERAGMACLRLNLRGADGSGEDFYHGGLTADLEAAVASREAAQYASVYILGYSLGGHVALRYASSVCPPERVRAVAGVCAPLHLAPCSRRLDSRGAWPYRAYLLRTLKRNYALVAARRDLPTPAGEVRRAKTLREFDRLAVAPRHGFEGPDDYYTRASVGPLLGDLARPALLVASRADPMVPPESIEPWGETGNGKLHVVWAPRGGHVGLPRDLDLGFGGALGAEGQAIEWLRRHGNPP